MMPRESRELKALLERGMDGMLLVGTAHESEVWRLVDDRRAGGRHLVLRPRCGRPCIGFDNAAPRPAFRHLLELGHDASP